MAKKIFLKNKLQR